MKFYITRTSLLFIFSILMTLSAVGNPRSNRNTDEEKKHLFPGTGFFIKNRNPYENEEAKEWFIEALKLQKEGCLSPLEARPHSNLLDVPYKVRGRKTSKYSFSFFFIFFHILHFTDKKASPQTHQQQENTP